MIAVVYFGVSVIIFYKETKHILVGDGILDEIFVETFSEDLLCGMLVSGIFRKYWRAGKTEYL